MANNMTLEEKKKALAKLQAEQSKKYGEENIPRLATQISKVEFYSTGIAGIDMALGGGIARKRLIGISGSESSCKTTLALTTISTQMKLDPNFMAYIYDAENSFDKSYYESLGIDLTRLIVDNTQIAEEGLTKLRDAINTGMFGIAVLDSTNALSPAKDNEQDISSISMGARARLLSNFYSTILGVVAKNKCTLIVIEQMRKAIGVMFGSPEVNTVGEAGKFAFSQRIIMRRQSKVEEEKGIAISNEVKCKVIKNKVAPPFRTCALTCIYGKGFDMVIDVANLSTQLNVAQKSGAWIYYPNKETAKDEHKFNGLDKYVKYLKDNPELKEEIYKKVMDTYNNTDSKSVMQDTDTTDKEMLDMEKLASVCLTENDVEE